MSILLNNEVYKFKADYLSVFDHSFFICLMFFIIYEYSFLSDYL